MDHSRHTRPILDLRSMHPDLQHDDPGDLVQPAPRCLQDEPSHLLHRLQRHAHGHHSSLHSPATAARAAPAHHRGRHRVPGPRLDTVSHLHALVHGHAMDERTEPARPASRSLHARRVGRLYHCIAHRLLAGPTARLCLLCHTSHGRRGPPDCRRLGEHLSVAIRLLDIRRGPHRQPARRHPLPQRPLRRAADGLQAVVVGHHLPQRGLHHCHGVHRQRAGVGRYSVGLHRHDGASLCVLADGFGAAPQGRHHWPHHVAWQR